MFGCCRGPKNGKNSPKWLKTAHIWGKYGSDQRPLKRLNLHRKQKNQKIKKISR